MKYLSFKCVLRISLMSLGFHLMGVNIVGALRAEDSKSCEEVGIDKLIKDDPQFAIDVIYHIQEKIKNDPYFLNNSALKARISENEKALEKNKKDSIETKNMADAQDLGAKLSFWSGAAISFTGLGILHSVPHPRSHANYKRCYYKVTLPLVALGSVISLPSLPLGENAEKNRKQLAELEQKKAEILASLNRLKTQASLALKVKEEVRKAIVPVESDSEFVQHE